ncbi:MAG: peptidoglycan DD-metalloendopeptidase family protein [Candidatus Woesearchaeota archaeon]|jgi:murein DD-endopeptidase MepM/ murein hydrolase activator NlpD
MNKKAQFFMPLFFILTLIIFTTLYLDFSAKTEQFECSDYGSYSCKLGEKQLAVLKTAQDGEKALLYIDIAAQYAYETALLETAKKSYIPTESNCGYYRGTPVFYGTTDCMSYNEELQKELETTLTTNFNTAFIPYVEAYQYIEIPENNYVITFTDKIITGIATQEIEIPIFSYTSIPIEEISTEQAFTASGILFSQWPVALDKHTINSCFGYRGNNVQTKSGVKASSNHGGIDINAPKGTLILSIADGIVTQISPITWGSITIDHGNGIYSKYLHMDTISVEKGQTVTKGQEIGTAGGRGANGNPDAYAAHLHFSILDTNIDANLKDSEGNKAVLSENSVNPLCYFSPDIQYTNYNNLGCRSEGGPLKFCSLYYPPVSFVTGAYTPSASAKEMLLNIQKNYGSIIDQAMVGKTIPTGLVYGLMGQESGGNPNAGSKTGCMGLMQFCGSTAYDYNLCSDPKCLGTDYRTNPLKSIPAGVLHLQNNVDEFSTYTDKLKFGAAAYNAGGGVIRNAIKKTGKSNPSWEEVSAALDASCVTYFKTTEEKNDKVIEIRNHVPRVMGYYYAYEQLQNKNDINTNP